MVSSAIADAMRAEFSDLVKVPLTPNSDLSSLSKLWLEHVTLRHSALLGECCAATVVLNSPSTVSNSLVQSARDFGRSWGRLTRLLAEVKFVNEAQLKIDEQKNWKSLASDFTESGLPEPTLAGVLYASLGDIAIISDLYKSLATSLTLQLHAAFERLLQSSDDRNDVRCLIEESVNLLAKEAS
ncbi:unnamed protein product [Hydatigera taeniaeformis]|uniref:Conserved oligomeric Golgi complex subunit 7 n=1 Tax=Hydatigena taeniaeformis TaxID=6205 RepID=A0A0R3WS58_HYDTA|nr:unnamed protein product [Hydatigera taeniaeformis]